MTKVAVIGAGSWGTTVANVSAHNQPTMIWAREDAVVDGINERQENPLFLDGIRLQNQLTASNDLGDALDGADLAVVAVPSELGRSALSGDARQLFTFVNVENETGIWLRLPGYASTGRAHVGGGTWSPGRSGGPRLRRPRGGVMQGIKEAASCFLATKRIAVTGVSRTAKGHGSNLVYQRLRERGYQVFAVNPNADRVEGDVCYPDLKSIPGGVEAVVIGTRPETADATMHECAQLGIKQVWMHRSYGAGSVSPTATTYGRQQGITVLDGGCPLMFNPTADAGHKAMRFMLMLAGSVPRRV